MDKGELSLLPAAAIADLAGALETLAASTLEPNIFFDPRFLGAATARRLGGRALRLAVTHDGDPAGRIRMMMPFTIERTARWIGVPMLRSWATPFAPLGTPLVDAADPAGAIAGFLALTARPTRRASFCSPTCGSTGRSSRCWPRSAAAAACRSSARQRPRGLLNSALVPGGPIRSRR